MLSFTFRIQQSHNETLVFVCIVIFFIGRSLLVVGLRGELSMRNVLAVVDTETDTETRLAITPSTARCSRLQDALNRLDDAAEQTHFARRAVRALDVRQPVDDPAEHVGRKAERQGERERNVEQLRVNRAPSQRLQERVQTQTHTRSSDARSPPHTPDFDRISVWPSSKTTCIRR